VDVTELDRGYHPKNIMTKNTAKKKRAYKKYFKQQDLAMIFGYSSPKSFSATSSKKRILKAVDEIVKQIENKLLLK
jgi:hypothetical protein